VVRMHTNDICALVFLDQGVYTARTQANVDDGVHAPEHGGGNIVICILLCEDLIIITCIIQSYKVEKIKLCL
jgi:hypothetical protein